MNSNTDIVILNSMAVAALDRTTLCPSHLTGLLTQVMDAFGVRRDQINVVVGENWIAFLVIR